MVRYLLDTNICIYLAQGCSEPLRVRLSRCLSSEVAISSITLAELEHGAARRGKTDELVAIRKVLQVLPFDDAAAKTYARIAIASSRQRGALDKLIAAHALSLGATLVTNNEADFHGYPVAVENWTRADG